MSGNFGWTMTRRTLRFLPVALVALPILLLSVVLTIAGNWIVGPLGIGGAVAFTAYCLYTTRPSKPKWEDLPEGKRIEARRRSLAAIYLALTVVTPVGLILAALDAAAGDTGGAAIMGFSTLVFVIVLVWRIQRERHLQ